MNLEKLKAIYSEAAAIPSANERRSYLDRACADDSGLRAQVEALLAAQDKLGDFLDAPPFAAPTNGQATVLAPAPPGTAGARIGRYKLLQPIGEGGFGDVWMAEQEEPVRRKVALKLIKAGMDTKQVIARFESERQALALMDHPNIAQVLDGDETDTGRPYFVMELIKGTPITEFCDRKKLTTRQRLDLFIPVCHAVQHAHQKGIIHRDLKPSNVLVTMIDGQPVPKVIDFGVAKAIGQRLTDKTLFTRFEQIIGTPAYMSPEQAELSGRDLDTRSDIYALGALLYELLTGTPPIDSEALRKAGLEEILRLIRQTDPPKPSTRLQTIGEKITTVAECRQVEPATLCRTVRGDLDWIVMKCLEKDRNRRYETASGLGMDLQRHLNHEPVVASPPSKLYQFQKFVRRNRLQVALAASLAAALIVGLAFTVIGFAQARRERDRALAAEAQAETARKKETQARQQAQQEELRTRQFLYVSDMNQARVSLQEGNLRRAVELLDRHRPKTGETDLRDWEWRYLWQMSRSDELSSLGSHSNYVKAVAFSPDGKRVVSGGWGSLLMVWDFERSNRIASLTGESVISDLAFSPDGRLLAAVEKKGIAVRDAETFQLISYSPLATWPHRLRFSPDGRRLAVLYATGGGAIWDCQRWQELVRFQTQGSDYRGLESGHSALAYSPDGRSLAVAEGGGRILLIDPETGKAAVRWEGSNVVHAAAFAPDGQTLASAEHRTVRLRRVSSGEVIWSRTNHTEWIAAVAFSPDGQTLASAAADQSIRLWDVASGRERARWQGNLEEFWAMAWSPDGQALVTGGKDGAVKVWSAVPTGKENPRRLVQENVGHFDFASDGTTLLVWSRPLKNRFLLGDFPLALSPGRDRIAFAGGSNPAGEDLNRLYLMGPRDRRVEFVGQHPEAIDQIAFSPDGKSIAAASGAAGAWLWEASAGGGKVGMLGSGLRILRIRSVTFSPDGRRVATAGHDGLIQLWDLATRQDVLTLEVPDREEDYPHVERLRFSPDGQALVALLSTGQCYLWRVPTPEAIARAEANQAASNDRSPARVDLPAIPSRQANLAEAEELEREALKQLIKLGDTDEPDAAHVLLRLASILYNQDNYPEAERLNRKALELMRKLVGEQDLNVAVLLNNLARTLLRQGKLAEAESLAREALAMRRKLHGDEDQNLIGAFDALADVFVARGQFAEAEGFLRQSLAIARKVSQGQDDLQVAWVLNELGGALWQQRKFTEAETAHREALGIRRKLLGEEDGLVANSLNDLALVLGDLRKLAEAEQAFRESIAIERKSRGQETSNFATSLHNLAWVLWEQGKLSEAEAQFREVLGIQKRRTGEKNPELIYTIHSLAGLLQQQGKLAEAEELNRQAVAIARASLEKEHVLFAGAINNLAGVLQQQAKFADAEPLRREALELRRAQFGADSKQVLDAIGGVGGLLYEWSCVDPGSTNAASRRQEAEQLLNDHAAGMRRRYADWQPDGDSYQGKLPEFAAGLHWARGPAAALAFLREATERAPDDFWSWYLLGIYQLFYGDVDGYERTCRQMLRRWADTQDPVLAEVTVITWHLLSRDLDVEAQAALDKFIARFAPIEKPWNRRAAGLHYHRCGRPSDALEQLRPILDHGWPRLRAAARSIAALVRHGLGEVEAAGRDLLEAEAALRTIWPDPLTESPPFLDQDTMRALVLFREAQALLDGASAAAPSVR